MHRVFIIMAKSLLCYLKIGRKILQIDQQRNTNFRDKITAKKFKSMVLSTDFIRYSYPPQRDSKDDFSSARLSINSVDKTTKFS